jgi:hypothetical protein
VDWRDNAKEKRKDRIIEKKKRKNDKGKEII